MIIVQAADGKYKHYVRYNMAKAADFGYRIEVFNLGKLGFGRKPATKFRTINEKMMASVILSRQVMEETGESVLYMDGDAILHEKIGALLSDSSSFDIGVTPESIWHSKRLQTRQINSAVYILNPTTATFSFLDRWADSPKDDQTRIRELLGRGFDDMCWRRNQTFPRGGVNVKFFPLAYNTTYAWSTNENLPEDTKIVHFKKTNNRRGRFKRYLRYYWSHCPVRLRDDYCPR